MITGDAAASKPHVLVLGGGPDAERQVSLNSARAIAGALHEAGHTVTSITIDRPTLADLRAMPGAVIFPALHGRWGEGGPLQELLEADGRPFVASGSRAARWAMDKVATKQAALMLGIPCTITHILDARDTTCPLPFPVVIKPIHEGSTIGLWVVSDAQGWERALGSIRGDIDRPGWLGKRTYMIEPKVGGARRARELTVGILDGKALPTIEIVPAVAHYDYEAKYHRDDTQYILNPPLPADLDARIKRHTESLAQHMGIRHVARADYLLDQAGTPYFLEINTLPGFTDHSLVPKAAASVGLPMPALCAQLVAVALRDHARTSR